MQENNTILISGLAIVAIGLYLYSQKTDQNDEEIIIRDTINQARERRQVLQGEWYRIQDEILTNFIEKPTFQGLRIFKEKEPKAYKILEDFKVQLLQFEAAVNDFILRTASTHDAQMNKANIRSYLDFSTDKLRAIDRFYSELQSIDRNRTEQQRIENEKRLATYQKPQQQVLFEQTMAGMLALNQKVNFLAAQQNSHQNLQQQQQIRLVAGVNQMASGINDNRTFIQNQQKQLNRKYQAQPARIAYHQETAVGFRTVPLNEYENQDAGKMDVEYDNTVYSESQDIKAGGLTMEEIKAIQLGKKSEVYAKRILSRLGNETKWIFQIPRERLTAEKKFKVMKVFKLTSRDFAALAQSMKIDPRTRDLQPGYASRIEGAQLALQQTQEFESRIKQHFGFNPSLIDMQQLEQQVNARKPGVQLPSSPKARNKPQGEVPALTYHQQAPQGPISLPYNQPPVIPGAKPGSTVQMLGSRHVEQVQQVPLPRSPSISPTASVSGQMTLFQERSN